MKLLILALCLSTASFAQASDLSIFVGKYEVGECDFDVNRVYSSVKTDRFGDDYIQLNLYGNDAIIIVMDNNESSTKENPNYQYGNPIKSTVTETSFEKGILINTERYLLPNGREEGRSSQKLEKTKRGLKYTTTHRDNKETCELIKL